MRRPSVWPNDRARAIHDVIRLPDVRRIELGWGASVIGELAGQVTLVVYSFAGLPHEFPAGMVAVREGEVGELFHGPGSGDVPRRGHRQ